jgi:hypothetical protein
MAMELWLSIVAILVSVASVVFVILEVGMKLGVGFREEETTSTRKAKIEGALKVESDTELADIRELVTSKEGSEKDLKERILNLARIEYYSDFTKNLLDRMKVHSDNFLRGSIASVIVVFLTIAFWAVALQDVTNVDILVLMMSFAYLGLAIYILHMTHLSIRKYYNIRDAFVRLSEEPSCDKCQEIDESLEEKGISM